MIDPELVTRKLALITADLQALAPLAAKTLDEFLASDTDEVLVERYLERIVGRMLDVNYHLLVESGQRPPKDYYESFTQLAKVGVLSAAFATRIAACAGLRNRLVHEYDDIDPERMHEAASTALKDVPDYLRLVRRFADGA
jgi:uncharacterized protein YutE (UPF0331/DUF86 family)